MAKKVRIELEVTEEDSCPLMCCEGCGRDSTDYLCNRCSSDYDTPTLDTLDQFAGRWEFDMSQLTDDEIQDLQDMVLEASREACPSYREEKIYEAFESVFVDFG